MTVIEVPETQTTPDAFGNMLTFNGTWASTANTAYSGGNAQVTSTVGSNVAIQFNNARAVYLLTENSPTTGFFSIALDGVLYPGSVGTAGAVQMYRVLHPLMRNLSLSSTPHTLLLTLISGSLTVDSVIVISGNLLTPTPGTVALLGDSVFFGNGSSDPTRFGMAPRLASLLGLRLNVPSVNMQNLGVPSDSLFCKDSTHLGLMHRLITGVVPLAPSHIVINSGINDIYANVGQPADYLRQTMVLLCAIEDIFDTTQVIVALATPTPIMPLYFGNSSSNQGTKDDNYLAAVEAARMAAQQFAWCRMADLYAVLENHESYNIPNQTGNTFDPHPNDAGHGLAAMEMFHALTAIDSGAY